MTHKQVKAIQKTLENGGNITQAMKDAGYKDATINNPKNLTESKAWLEIIGEQLPDEEIVAVHKKGLYAKRIHGTNDNFIEIEDYPTQLRAVELAYKVKGRLKDGLSVGGDVTMNVVVIRHADT